MSEHEGERGDEKPVDTPADLPLPGPPAGAGLDTDSAAQRAKMQEPYRRDKPGGKLLSAVRSFFTRP